MVIREEISSTKSLLYSPICQVAEASDGTLVIHNDFRTDKAHIVTSKFEDWNYIKVKEGLQEQKKDLVIDSGDNKLRSFVLINDPTYGFFNTTTNKALVIDKQYVISSTQDPPSKEQLGNSYKTFVDQSMTLLKIM